jgi:hypothetical protein
VFVRPQNGALVRPGQLLHIEVSITPGKIIDGPIAIVSELGVSNEIRESPPYSFTMTVSQEDYVGAGSPLIGKHSITAFGRVKGQEGYGLAAIDVDVEESDVPTKLSASGNMMSQHGPPGLRFFGAGAQQSLAISGKFPNGDEFDVTNSTYLKLVSANPKVVSVSEEGMLTSIGSGNTSITALYQLGAQTLQVSVPVSVAVSNSGLIPSPLSLDFGDQPVGTASIPLQVILTNRSVSTITIYKFEIRAEVRESDDCTSAPLPPDGTCTISVTYVPYRAGPSRGIIYVPNSHTGMVSLPVSGNGI